MRTLWGSSSPVNSLGMARVLLSSALALPAPGLHAGDQLFYFGRDPFHDHLHTSRVGVDAVAES